MRSPSLFYPLMCPSRPIAKLSQYSWRLIIKVSMKKYWRGLEEKVKKTWWCPLSWWKEPSMTLQDQMKQLLDQWPMSSRSIPTLFWTSRKDMDTLGFIFEKKLSIRDNRSKYNDKLCQPVPGHPELTSNKMAQIWNNLKLNNAKSIACVRASALEWYRENPKSWLMWYFILFYFSFS